MLLNPVLPVMIQSFPLTFTQVGAADAAIPVPSK